jgi:ABC-type multidrug transport system ATPase subunit
VNLSALPSAGIRFENIEKRYGGVYALHRISLDVKPRESVILVGRNGSGKTTLLRVAAGLARPTAGRVSILAEGSGGRLLRPRLGFVGHQSMTYDELTAEENLALFARLLGLGRCREEIRTLLEGAGLGERRASLVRTFSRGMRQRLAIARNLLAPPLVFLLDEPDTGLDTQGTAWLATTLRRLSEAGCTMLMSLHGQSALGALATRALRLEAGRVGADSESGVSIAKVLAFADA